MTRWLWFVLCIVVGLAAIYCGLLVPAHLRAVDADVLRVAGQNTPTLAKSGAALVNDGQWEAAQLLMRAAREQDVPGREELSFALNNSVKRIPLRPSFAPADSAATQAVVKVAETSGTNSGWEPFTEWVIRLENRDAALTSLETSKLAVVREVLRFRSVTNTSVFPPSASSSGQALDAALAICGLLLQDHQLSPGLSNAVFFAAATANRGGDTQEFEQMLMDFMSLGQRLTWGQLTALVARVDDPETLRLQANLARTAGGGLAELFSAVQLSGNPAGVANYLVSFGRDGWDALGASLRFGAGGVNELLKRNQRLHFSRFSQAWLLGSCWTEPWLALALKWGLYFGGGFLLAMALHLARPAVSALERPLQVRGFHIAREILFALGFLLVVLLVSEPFLAQETQKVEFPFRLRLPMVGGAVPAGKPGAGPSLMNHTVLLTMLLFFVLQALLYAMCLFKLAEIRRQRVPARMKLKLLENEDHLFDAGFYLGFLGTIISLILVSLGVFKQPSLMAAYSSTSFGILFVVLFKVVHLRPARRKLLLEAS